MDRSIHYLKKKNCDNTLSKNCAHKEADVSRIQY